MLFTLPSSSPPINPQHSAGTASRAWEMIWSICEVRKVITVAVKTYGKARISELKKLNKAFRWPLTIHVLVVSYFDFHRRRSTKSHEPIRVFSEISCNLVDRLAESPL